MELVHFKIQTMETLCKPLINTSAEKYDDISDYHDEDEEVVFQYGTNAWTSDPTQEVERSLQFFQVSAKHIVSIIVPIIIILPV